METTHPSQQGARDPSIRTFRGATLEEVLPRIREELGEDAIVMARREGLTGGIGGFFQRQFVEVEARPGLSAVVDEDGELPVAEGPFHRNDAATAEGLGTPAMQELLRQAAPFARELEQASAAMPEPPADRTPTLSEVLGTGGTYGPRGRVEERPPVPPTESLLPAVEPPAHGPAQAAPPAPPAPAPPAAAPAAGPAPITQADVSPAPVPDEPASGDPPPPPRLDEVAARGTRRPGTADPAERRLVASGLSATLAAEVVGEAVVHGLPFSSPRNLRKLARAALARRIRVLEALGPAPRSLALVGPGGAGKTTLAAHLAEAYARNSDLEVLVIALRPADDGATLRRLLDGTGAEVAVVTSADDARKRAAAQPGRMIILDMPAVAPRDGKAIEAMARELHDSGVEEVHLCVPAATSAPAARELSSKYKPLGATHIALTHADATEAAGAVAELCLDINRPLSYVAEYESVVPADPLELATRLLP